MPTACSDVPTVLAISPHLDDAVFSAGGTLARLAVKGWRVVVATVFTASVPNPRGFALACQLDKGLAPAIDYMALRRDEDAAACTTIGAEPRWLAFAEAPHRGYESAEALFAGLHKDDEIVTDIVPALSDLVLELSPDLLFSPQAIGAHVDHVAVYMALRSHDWPCWLWADFPYILRPTLRASPFAEDLRGLRRQDIALRPDEIRLKAQAATAYASQVAFQFGSPASAASCITVDGGVERFVSHRSLQMS